MLVNFEALTLRFVAILVAIPWGDYQMESNVKHEFTLPEWKENSRGNPYGQPHLVLFGSPW